MRGTHSHPLSLSAVESTGTMVRKIGKVSAPVDPLRTRTSGTSRASRTYLSAPSTKWLTAENEAPPKKKQAVSTRREQSPPHNRSWALRPAATSVTAASVSDVEQESSASVSSERPRLVPLGREVWGGGGGGYTAGRKTRSEEGDKEGKRTWSEEGGGGERGMRPDLAQMLRDLEASPGEESEGERPLRGLGEQATGRHPFPPASASSKRRRLAGMSHRMCMSRKLVFTISLSLPQTQRMSRSLHLLLTPSLTTMLKYRSEVLPYLHGFSLHTTSANRPHLIQFEY